MKDGTVGAELGVFRGVFSEFILKNTKIEKLYMVDAWDIFGETFGWSDDYTCNGTLPTSIARKEAEDKKEEERQLVRGLGSTSDNCC